MIPSLRSPRHHLALVAAAMTLMGCAGADGRAAATARLQATPDQWDAALPAVLTAGSSAAPHLIAGLETTPEAPGAQAATFALGRVGDVAAVPLLAARLNRAEDHAYEAAIALGRLGEAAALEPLRAAATDRSQTPRVRAAAACSLLDLGDVGTAMPLLQAVLLLGTPHDRQLAAQHGFVRQDRWALERWLAIEAIARNSGGERFGLDPDAPWPQLRDGVARWVEFVRSR
ncbi:MAG: HEAT repeat domain-containing protein [Planctomycetota bacterium]